MKSFFIVLIGIGIIFFRYQIKDLFGNIEPFEKHLGSTENGLVISGIGCIFMAMVYGFGFLDGAIQGFIQTFFTG